MRLLQLNPDGSLALVLSRADKAPSYAILSHTWKHGEEYTFEDLMRGVGREKSGYAKIQFCRRQAAADGLHYIWADTCCIDKSNNTELTTAINSMFQYYQNAAKCYVYLSDVFIPAHIVDPQSCTPIWEGQFRRSQWFARGWTLQELLAPGKVEFFARDGKRLGDKHSLEKIICETTAISVQALRGMPLSRFSVSERLRWTSMRSTTEKEDEAYCLLGVFGVSMPLIYGEGRNALVRLRNKIDESFIGSTHESVPNARTRDMNQSMNASKSGWIDSSGTLNNNHNMSQTLETSHYPNTPDDDAEDMEFLFPKLSMSTKQDDFALRSEVFVTTPSLAYDAETLPQSEQDFDFCSSDDDDDDYCVVTPAEDARRMSIREGKKKCFESEMPCSPAEDAKRISIREGKKKCLESEVPRSHAEDTLRTSIREGKNKCLESEVPRDAAISGFSASASNAVPKPSLRKATEIRGAEKGKGKRVSEPREREGGARVETIQERHIWQHSELKVYSSPLDWVAQFQST